MFPSTKYSAPCNAASLQQGQIDALTCYCYRYLKPLTRYAAYITKNEIAAPDLANASLEQLWNKRLGMVDERTVHRFLCKNIRTICNQWLYEQLIIQGYLTMPDGWQPKYSKMENSHRPIPKSNPPTNPASNPQPNPNPTRSLKPNPNPTRSPEPNPHPKTNPDP